MFDSVHLQVCDLLCFGRVDVSCLFLPEVKGAKSLIGLHPFVPSFSYLMYMHVLIIFSCLFHGIKTLCTLVWVEHCGTNSVSTTAAVPFARLNLHLPELRLVFTQLTN